MGFYNYRLGSWRLYGGSDASDEKLRLGWAHLRPGGGGWQAHLDEEVRPLDAKYLPRFSVFFRTFGVYGDTRINNVVPFDMWREARRRRFDALLDTFVPALSEYAKNVDPIAYLGTLGGLGYTCNLTLDGLWLAGRKEEAWGYVQENISAVIDAGMHLSLDASAAAHLDSMAWATVVKLQKQFFGLQKKLYLEAMPQDEARQNWYWLADIAPYVWQCKTPPGQVAEQTGNGILCLRPFRINASGGYESLESLAHPIYQGLPEPEARRKGCAYLAYWTVHYLTKTKNRLALPHRWLQAAGIADMNEFTLLANTITPQDAVLPA
ncbi:MAG: hypothetical protein IT443_12050 [Phycisphaeraceae bacterium]|nr:hypothetical protein [Phycisphaeraceae bacterium]